MRILLITLLLLSTSFVLANDKNDKNDNQWVVEHAVPKKPAFTKKKMVFVNKAAIKRA